MLHIVHVVCVLLASCLFANGDAYEPERASAYRGRKCASRKQKSPATCPANWEPIGNSCYMFIFDSMATWQDAQNICNMADPNGKLAEIETEAEHTNIVNRLGTDPLLGALWIGGQDSNSDDVWVWDSTGEDITNGFTNWDATFPTTNMDPLNTPQAMCMAIFLSQGMRWRNFDCGTTQGYICETTRSSAVYRQ